MSDATPTTGGRARPRPLHLSPGAVVIAALVVVIYLLATHALPGYGAAAPAPKAYVGLFKDNAVAVVDTGTNQVLKTVPIPAGPHGLVATPDGRRVYASSDGASTVSVIDAATDQVNSVRSTLARRHS